MWEIIAAVALGFLTAYLFHRNSDQLRAVPALETIIERVTIHMDTLCANAAKAALEKKKQAAPKARSVNNKRGKKGKRKSIRHRRTRQHAAAASGEKSSSTAVSHKLIIPYYKEAKCS